MSVDDIIGDALTVENMVGGAGLATILQDPLTDTDGVLLTDHIPPIGTWLSGAGNNKISSNMAKYDNGVASGWATIAVNYAISPDDAFISGDITFNEGAMVTRFQDRLNFVLCWVGSGGNPQIYSVIAGAALLRATDATGSSGTRLARAQSFGDIIKWEVDGNLIQWDTGGLFTSGDCGILTRSTNQAFTFDDILITESDGAQL